MGDGKETSHFNLTLIYTEAAAFLGTTEGLGGSQRRAPRRERRARTRVAWRQLVKQEQRSQMRWVEEH